MSNPLKALAAGIAAGVPTPAAGRKSDAIRAQIAALEDEGCRGLARVRELQAPEGPLALAITAGDEKAKQLILQEIGALTSFQSALPAMINPLDERLVEAENEELAEDIAVRAKAVEKLTEETVPRVKAEIKKVIQAVENLEKLNQEFCKRHDTIQGRTFSPERAESGFLYSGAWFTHSQISEFSTKEIISNLVGLDKFLENLPGKNRDLFLDDSRIRGNQDARAAVLEMMEVLA